MKGEDQKGGFKFDFETTQKGKAAKLQQKKQQQQQAPQLSPSMLKELERQQQMWKQKQEQDKQEEKGELALPFVFHYNKWWVSFML